MQVLQRAQQFPAFKGHFYENLAHGPSAKAQGTTAKAQGNFCGCFGL